MKVSVAMITYNHESFIAQAIESALMQKTNFDFEIIIGEDCSKDKTRLIVREYAEKFPNIIKLLLHQQNIGPISNFVAAYQKCRGQYIAFLEGDDYWTDPYKLQKQSDFLDTHPDFVSCVHWTDIIDEEGGRIISTYGLGSKHGPRIIKSYYTSDDVFEDGLFFHTCSMMVRKLFDNLPKWFMKSNMGDIMLTVLNAQYGKIGFLNETMAVWRAHRGGISAGQKPLTNLKRIKDVFLLIGSNLNLSNRFSFRRGLSKIYINLCDQYYRNGNTANAVFAGYKAMKTAPNTLRKQTLSQILSILIAFRFIQALHIIRVKVLEIIKYRCGDKTYNKIKMIYHYLTDF